MPKFLFIFESYTFVLPKQDEFETSNFFKGDLKKKYFKLIKETKTIFTSKNSEKSHIFSQFIEIKTPKLSKI